MTRVEFVEVTTPVAQLQVCKFERMSVNVMVREGRGGGGGRRGVSAERRREGGGGGEGDGKTGEKGSK
jgi:hypothetical protein